MTMTARWVVFGVVAALVGPGLPGRVAADFGDFTYSTTVNVDNGGAVAPNPPGSTTESIDIGNGNVLTFVAKTNGQGKGAIPGGADIEVGRVIFEPSATTSTLTPYEVSYNFLISLTDSASSATGQFNYTGSFSGFAAGEGGGSSPTINTTSITFAVSPSMLLLGGVPYLLNAKSASGPNSGGVLSPGLFQANVSVVPEPGALVLLGIGGAASLLLLRLGRRRAS